VRVLSHYRYRINGQKRTPVTSAPVSHTEARFEFTNPAVVVYRRVVEDAAQPFGGTPERAAPDRVPADLEQIAA